MGDSSGGDVLVVVCAGGWMPHHLSEGWRRLGFRVHEFTYGTHMGKAWDTAGLSHSRGTNERLIETARRLKGEGRLDLIFAVIYDDMLEERTAKLLRALGVPMVNYHVDLVGQWYRVLRTGRYFDRVACAQRDHWAGLRRAGSRPYYMPMAANPPAESDAVQPEEYAGVLYLGSPWPYRRQVLADLVRRGFPVRIYGNNWVKAAEPDSAHRSFWRKDLHDAWHYLTPRLREEGVGHFLESARRRLAGARSPEVDVLLPSKVIQGAYAQDRFAPMVRGAAVNLGFTHFRGTPGSDSEQRQVRLRDFEVPLAGGFYLVQHCTDFDELFHAGEHLEVWRSPAELEEKARYYLDHPDERQRIARQGEAYTRAHHTWAQRFRDLLAELSLPAPAAENWVGIHTRA